MNTYPKPIKLLVDSGASTSLIQSGLFHKSFKTELEKHVTLKSVNANICINSKITIPLFKEFNRPSTTIEMLETDLNSDFDGIIGCNILKPLQAKLDFNSSELITKEAIIPLIFSHSSSQSTDKEINTYCKDIIDINFVEPDIDTIIDRLTINNLNKEEIQFLTTTIRKFKKVFYLEGDNLSCVSNYSHKIPTKNDIPIFSKTYRYPEAHKEEVDKQISDMLRSGIIIKSTSPYNAPIWVVEKKLDNSGQKNWRIVIDYRKLNEITVEDKFPIPNIEDIFSKLGNAQYFSTLDLAKGFHQIPINVEDRHKTAFSTTNGHYEFTRMPFGLKNAPASFQRMMNEVLSDYINKICVVYLDDILIFSTSLQEHIDSLNKIFKRLLDFNLKVQINKCDFLKHETEYLGHIISRDGIKPNPNKIEVIKKIQLPKSTKQIKSFLGITGFYRKFIKDYSKVALPMTRYLKKGSELNVKDRQYIESFNKLKALICTCPILAYPNFAKTFTLTTDASNSALGAVLSQNQHPIAFASRTLNRHETNYSTVEKELLSIVWATKYFRPYLFGRKFKVQTDHRPLVWLNSLKEPNSKLQRWKIKLNEYDFEIEYIKGKENYVADFLSRLEANCVIENDVRSDIATIHSGKENLNDHIFITETPLNIYKNQLIFETGKSNSYSNKFLFKKKRRSTFTLKNYDEEYVLKILKELLPIKGTVGIFCKEDSMFNKFQKTIIKYFSNSPTMKMLRCTKLLEDITSKESY